MTLDQDAHVEVDATTTSVTEDTQSVFVGDQVGEGSWHGHSVCGKVAPASPLNTRR
jgi:hypothetical protein